jgi:hypothetical protein
MCPLSQNSQKIQYTKQQGRQHTMASPIPLPRSRYLDVPHASTLNQFCGQMRFLGQERSKSDEVLSLYKHRVRVDLQ